MRFSADLKGDKQALKMLRNLGKIGQQAITRATNNGGRRARTLASKEIRSEVNLKAGYVRERLRIRKATRNKPEYVISATKRGVLMTRYPYTEKAGGVSVKIKRKGARTLVRGGFVVTLNAGGRKVEAVAIRQSGKFKTGNRRFKVLYSPSVSQVFNRIQDQITPEVIRYYGEQIDKELIQALKRLDKRNGR